MNITTYTEPLIKWLSLNPDSALLCVFIIAFLESIAVLGSFIPGAIIMTAIGILAGSKVIPINLTMVMAITGAIFGDSLSYLLGYTYKDKIADLWPFKRYPKFLAYGKDYFANHGIKSILIGRFFGPIRSIIPLIAGMLHMTKYKFFITNFFAAVSWAMVYLIPGILIGRAGNNISHTYHKKNIYIMLLLGLIVLYAGFYIIQLLWSRRKK
jgi:membrane protein DedA with SNARE-associated domain